MRPGLPPPYLTPSFARASAVAPAHLLAGRLQDRRQIVRREDVIRPGAIEKSFGAYFEQGVAVAGRIHVSANPNLLLEMLPVLRRRFDYYSVEVGTLRYSDDIVG